MTRPSLLAVLCACLGGGPLLAQSPPRVQVLHAQLFAPGQDQPLGGASNLTVTEVVGWVSPTRMVVAHRGPAFDLHAEIELRQETTFVEVSVASERVLNATGPWTVVMRPAARVPLVGGHDQVLELGFQQAHQMPVATAELTRVSPAVVPAARGPRETCLVSVIHAAPEEESARWEPASYVWAIHRGKTSTTGWRSAWAVAHGVVVHGFVADKDVTCGVGSGGGFGLKGMGAGSADGSVRARAAMLPAGTAFLAHASDTHPILVLHKRVAALQREDGKWIVPSITEGRAEVTLHGVSVETLDHVSLAPLATHGVGSSSVGQPEWPRRP